MTLKLDNPELWNQFKADMCKAYRKTHTLLQTSHKVNAIIGKMYAAGYTSLQIQSLIDYARDYNGRGKRKGA